MRGSILWGCDSTHAAARLSTGGRRHENDRRHFGAVVRRVLHWRAGVPTRRSSQRPARRTPALHERQAILINALDQIVLQLFFDGRVAMITPIVRAFRSLDEPQVIALWKSIFNYTAAHNDPTTVIRQKMACDPELFRWQLARRDSPRHGNGRIRRAPRVDLLRRCRPAPSAAGNRDSRWKHVEQCRRAGLRESEFASPCVQFRDGGVLPEARRGSKSGSAWGNC